MRGLTGKQLDMAKLASEGMTNDEIACLTGTTKKTVESHLRVVYRETKMSRDQLHKLFAGETPQEGK